MRRISDVGGKKSIMFNNMMMGGMIPLKLANRNTCRINGKTIQQVEEELAKDFPDSLLKETYDKYSYFPVEVLMERLDEVVGMSNYTVIPTPVQTEPMRYIARPNKEALQKQRADAQNAAEEKRLNRKLNDSEKVKYWEIQISEEELEPYECVEFMEKVVTAIAIYSDEGELAIIKYAYGSAKYEYVNTTGKLKELKNVPDSAVSDGSKRACHDLGIGASQLSRKKKQADKDKKFAGTEEFRIKLLKNFTSSNGYFRCPVLIEDSNEQRELFIGRESVLSENNKELLVKAPAGQRLTVRGRKNVFKEVQQIILIDIVKGGNGNGR